MSATGLILFIVIGLVAGWLAGQIVKGGGYGIVADDIHLSGGNRCVGRTVKFADGRSLFLDATPIPGSAE